MFADLRDDKLAQHLAETLTDLEFELLVRKRIELTYALVSRGNDDWGTSHADCSFTYKWDDKATWRCEVGSNYSDAVTVSGEVLTKTWQIAATQWHQQNGNKLSLLLSPPAVHPTLGEILEPTPSPSIWDEPV